MVVNKGIQILHESASQVALGTLASLAAIDLGIAYQSTNLKGGFLMKKIEGFFVIEGIDEDVQNSMVPLLVLTYGNSSVAEVAAAMVQEDPDPADDPLVNQATIRRIVQARGPDIMYTSQVTDTTLVTSTYAWDLSKFNQDFPSKGLPFSEEVGWAWRVFNLGSVFATGSRGSLFARIKGVWLSD